MTKDKLLKNSIVVGVIASLCCALWGSAFPLIKIGYHSFGIASGAANSQILFAGIRFFLAGIITLIIGSLLSGKVLVPTLRSWPKIIHLSFYQTFLQYIFFYIGLSHTTGVKASLVEGLSVFIVLFIAVFLFHQEKLTRQKVFGCIIGFIGVIIINMNGNGFSFDVRLDGEGFIFLSNIAYALSTVLLKQYSATENTTLLNGYQFIAGGLVMMAIGFFMGGEIKCDSFQSVGILFYLAFVTAVAYALWGILLKHNPISKVTIFIFMTPVFGVLLSALLLKESIIGIRSILALTFVSSGIFIVNYKKN